MREKESNKKKDNSRKEKEEKNKGMVVLPYMSGVSEKLARIFKKRKISSAMKPHTKLRALIVHPKGKTDPKEGVYTRLHRMREKMCQGNKEKIASESERTLIRDRKSKQRNQLHKRQEKTITNGDVGVSHNRLCNARKSSYRLGKRTNHRERERW